MAVTCRGIEDPSAGSNFLGKRVMGPFGGKREMALFRHNFKDEQKSRLMEIVKPFVEAPAFAQQSLSFCQNSQPQAAQLDLFCVCLVHKLSNEMEC